jgi:hypothetical protein
MHGADADSTPRRDLPDRQPLRLGLADCPFLAGGDLRPAQLRAAGYSSGEGGLDPFADNLALKLGEDAHHLKERSAAPARANQKAWSGGILGWLFWVALDLLVLSFTE